LELVINTNQESKENETVKLINSLFNQDKWEKLGLCKALLKSLKDTQFNIPTEI
jgi:hypothetical protein